MHGAVSVHEVFELSWRRMHSTSETKLYFKIFFVLWNQLSSKTVVPFRFIITCISFDFREMSKKRFVKFDFVLTLVEHEIFKKYSFKLIFGTQEIWTRRKQLALDCLQEQGTLDTRRFSR